MVESIVAPVSKHIFCFVHVKYQKQFSLIPVSEEVGRLLPERPQVVYAHPFQNT